MWLVLLISHFKILNMFLIHIIPNLSAFCIQSTPLETLRKRDKESLCREVERLSLWRQFCSILNSQTPFFKVQENKRDTDAIVPISFPCSVLVWHIKMPRKGFSHIR